MVRNFCITIRQLIVTNSHFFLEQYQSGMISLQELYNLIHLTLLKSICTNILYNCMLYISPYTPNGFLLIKKKLLICQLYLCSSSVYTDRRIDSIPCSVGIPSVCDRLIKPFVIIAGRGGSRNWQGEGYKQAKVVGKIELAKYLS